MQSSSLPSTHGVPPSETAGWRIGAVVLVLLLVFAAITARLVQVQWWDQSAFARHARRQRIFVANIVPRPGDILDRHGRLLATSVTTRSLFVDPARLSDPEQTATLLAEQLGVSRTALLTRFQQEHGSRFVWVKRRLSEEEVELIRTLDLPEASWGLRAEYQRKYPQGRLAAHLLGLRDIDGVGRGGVEESFDHLLRGRAGRRLLERDAHGRVLYVREDVALPPESGDELRLTIDAVIQLFVERELDRAMGEWEPRSACAIVIDPHTSEILAMASRPTYDPTHPDEVSDGAWSNTTLTAAYEPGSTVKPFFVAWALEQGLIRRDEKFHCEQGVYRMGRRLLHDHHPYGVLSLTDVLVKSSNIGMAKLGERLENPGLFEALTRFGFGRPTGIALPGERVGTLRPLQQWNGYSTGSIPMGQEFSVTPLQLITAHAALANGGRLIHPRVTIAAADTDADPLMTVCVSPEVADWIVQEPMRAVVDRGTGKRAQLPDVSVFGKTGTAQKVDPVTGRYSNSRHVCSFVCGAPADDPRALVLVLVDDPSTGPRPWFGGTVAAPAAARILDYTLARTKPSESARRTASRN